MPRLTRTQKFADLRDQLTTDSESTLKTEQNSQYDDRLSKLQGFSSVEQPAYQQPQQPVYEAPRFEQPVYQQPTYQAPVQETSPLDDLMGSVNNTFDDFVNNQQTQQAPSTSTIDGDMFDSLFYTSDDNKSSYGGTPLDFSVLDQKEEEPEVVTQNSFEDLTNSIINDIKEAEAASTYEQTTEEPMVDEFNPVEDMPSFFEQQAPVFEQVQTEEVQSQVETPVYEQIFETPVVEQPQVETPVYEQPQVETPVYEQPQVETPVYEQIFETPVVEQSQVETPSIEETPEFSIPEFEEVPVEANDEEFSNTVSLEISKIMDDLSVVEQREATQEIEATKIIEKVEEVKPVTPVVEDKDAVVIKNISELETASESTMSDTIPFIVENKETEVEEEEEGSNVILNIILIVLIIVLIAVLGLIVYYILKTKGIL